MKNGNSSPDAQGDARINRRELLKGSAVVMAATATATTLSANLSAQDAGPQRPSAAKRRPDSVVANAATAIVETDSGRIAGYLRQGIYAFKGVPYGDTTAGEFRFLPPRKPRPWSGVRSCRQYGFVAPQDKGTGRQNDEEAFLFQWNDSVEGEDCLRVNVWTPGLNDNRKRPVMVWLHGGGFTAGSGHDLPAFNGENLARRGDVVVVTLNHRLNILGYLDLSAYGERFAQSANVGMLDIVAALQWVRTNIAVLGGDPDRVLIFGQSGGGAKVSTLMGMPAAQGLFHRAIVHSGSFALNIAPESSRRLAQLVLSELAIAPSNVDRLQDLSYDELQRAGEAAMRKANQPVGSVLEMLRARDNLSFGPVVDGRVLPAAPFGETGPSISAQVPMIIGSTLNEFGGAMNHPEYEALTDADVLSRIEASFPGRAREILATFRRRAPGVKPYSLASRIVSAPIRRSAIAQARAKAALNGAPAYLFWFAWQTPVFDGRPGAFHCADIPFAFFNTDRCDTMTGGGQAARVLSARIADAWIQFARSGDPNHPGMPHWPAFSAGTVPTMIFDNDTHLALNPDGEEQASISGF